MLSWLILIERGFNHKLFFSDEIDHIIMFSENDSVWIGNDSNEDTPVPISNTEVKLINAEDSESENR